MLAPLNDRSILERAPESGLCDDDCPAAGRHLDRLRDDNEAMKQALRLARRTQKRNATVAARKIVSLTNELSRESERNRHLQTRIAELESGQAMLAMAQRLMALTQENEALADAAHHVWFLDRTLCAAHHECERLARERDAALRELQACTPD